MSLAIETTNTKRTMCYPLQNLRLPFGRARGTFGVYYDGKKIDTGIGLQKVDLPYFDLREIDKAGITHNLSQVFYQNGYYLLLCQDESVYLYHDKILQKLDLELKSLQAIELPQYFQGMLLSDGSTSYFFAENGQLQTIELPAFACGCYFYDRLILCHGQKILFSAIGDGLSFSGGGHIDLVDKKGEILACFPCGEKLIVFREYGIDSVILFGQMENFQVLSLQDTRQIANGSICRANDGKFYFYTQDGLFTFTMSKLEKVDIALEKELHFAKDMPAIYFQNAYYLVAKHRQEQAFSSSLFAIYPKPLSVALLATNASLITASNKKIFAILRGKLYTTTQENHTIKAKKRLQFTVQNPLLNGSLQSIRIDCPYIKTVTIQSPFGIRKKTLFENMQSMAVNLRGIEFCITIESESANFSLHEIELQFSSLKGVQYVNL